MAHQSSPLLGGTDISRTSYHSGEEKDMPDSSLSNLRDSNSGDTEESESVPPMSTTTTTDIMPTTDGVVGVDEGQSYYYEEALNRIGYGRFQWELLMICGWANAADAIEILAVSFALPDIAQEFHLTSTDQAILTGVLFLGMLIGGWTCGIIADRYGRRPGFLYTLFLNSLFGMLSCLAPTSFTLVAMRFMSGVGVGGSIPIVFAYFAEFLPVERRGTYMVFLAAFWMVGSIGTAGLAWLVIPRQSWRPFFFYCGIPSLVCVLLIYKWAPESPRYLLLKGRTDEAKEILNCVARVNGSSFQFNPQDRLLAGCDKVPQSDVESSYVQSSPSAIHARGASRETLATSEDESDTAPLRPAQVGSSQHTDPVTRNDIDDENDENGWLRMVLRLWGPDLIRTTVILSVVWASISYGFYGLTLWLPSFFKSKGLPMPDVYQNSFLVALANLPGNIAAAITVEVWGRRLTLAVSMVLSGVAAIAFVFAESPFQVTAVGCAFAAVSVGGWNALDIVSSEMYPTSVRSGGLGYLTAVGRLASIVAVCMNSFMLTTSPAIPLTITAVGMIGGGLVSFFLPYDTVRRQLQD
eukprot:TRINITY_DN1339_c0_g1_i1.p1 TRINITY_DN1339_c0_g1~~TRINITY_DN1339_c0_g1_i1.p1  ORF type:complete len:580 (+),score=72.99 TRINITY_DN1339_c0_g1_i1:220-1959(+)